MEVTEALISLYLNELYTQAAKAQKYKDYYEGKHDILHDYAIERCLWRQSMPEAITGEFDGNVLCASLHDTSALFAPREKINDT